MRRGPTLLAAAAVAGTLALGGCGTGDEQGATSSIAARSTAIPADFVGVVAPEILPLAAAPQEGTLRSQRAAGFGTLRQTFRWDYIEPSDGRWSWGEPDRLVGSAAQAGVTILPIIFETRPDQRAAPKPRVRVTESTHMPPKDPAVFAGFAATLVKRYGPGGSFWKEHPNLPERPMRSWQIWNEPNLGVYWGGRANQKEYARLLAASSAAIRAVDPGAEIITGGLPTSKRGIPVRDYIHLLAEASSPGAFDTVAIHPYGRSADAVIAGAVKARRWLDAEGLEKVDLRITEFGWATGGPKSPFTVGPEKQARLISEVLDRSAALRDELRLKGIVLYSWRDVPPPKGGSGKDYWGLHTGLNSLGGTAKPSLRAVTREIGSLRDR